LNVELNLESQLDVEDLRGKVQNMYEAVALHPHDGHFHFEMGPGLAERLGYPSADLDRVPPAAIPKPRVTQPTSGDPRWRLATRCRHQRQDNRARPCGASR
jgi:hypothetical protein